LQNGWGMNRLFETVFSKSQIFNTHIYCGFIRRERNHSHLTAYGGPTFIGNIFSPGRDNAITTLCELITNGGLPCEYTSDITTKIWSKMLYSCTTNPLSFIFDVKNGNLDESKHAREIINGIVEEIFRVLSRTSFKTNWKTASEYLNYFYNELLPLTKDHKSSMLQDKEQDKHTEIDFFNGAVVDLAKGYKIACPYNEIVYNMVKFIEQLPNAKL
jgi:2-dehydropantoate 2-reductase